METLEIFRFRLVETVLWAQARGVRPAKVAPTSWIWNTTVSVCLGLAVIIGVVVVYYLRRDFSESGDEISVTEEEQLAEFERAYEAGEMEEAEIRRVRDTLRRKLGLESLPSTTVQQVPAGLVEDSQANDLPSQAGPGEA